MTETIVACFRCGRQIPTTTVQVFRFTFPAQRVCDVCLETQHAEHDQERAELLLNQSAVPGSYRACTFAGFEQLPGTGDAYRAAREWSKEFRSSRQPRRGLFLSGPPGSGKTHLAAAILREAIFGCAARARFLNVPEWLDQQREFAAEGVHESLPRGFELVVIDDVGAEQLNAWSRDRLYSLLNHQESFRRPTVLTSNLRLTQVGERLGPAATSRLRSLAREVVLDPGRDFRLRDLQAAGA